MINVVKCTNAIYRVQNRIQLNSGCRARFFANTEASFENQEGFRAILVQCCRLDLWLAETQ